MTEKKDYDHPQIPIGSIVSGKFIYEYDKQLKKMRSGSKGLDLKYLMCGGAMGDPNDFYPWLSKLTEYDYFATLVNGNSGDVYFLYVLTNNGREITFPEKIIEIYTA